MAAIQKHSVLGSWALIGGCCARSCCNEIHNCMCYTTTLDIVCLCKRIYNIAACVMSSMGMDMPCTVSGTTEIEVSQGLNGNVGESSALDEFKFSNQKCPIFI